MIHKLIKTDNYLLVVDDSEIKEDCIAIHLGPLGEQEIVTANGECKLDKKIIGHLPIINCPILVGVPLLPPLEDDVEKIAREEILYNDAKREWWKQGYNKAKEKYKYTEEDMIQAFAYGRTLEPFDSFEDFIQSLSQPKMPTHFEIEMGTKYFEDSRSEKHPILVANSQGQTVLVGKYIYEGGEL